jgi:uncharacterized cupredoxin-like copper-binding protein
MAHDQPHGDERSESHERFLLPLVVPAAILLFAILVIYGLSRIYLELNDWHYKDVGMATPLAIGIAIVILAVSAILASRPVSGVVIGLIAVVAAAGLTGGAIWAAVHPDTALEVVVVPTATTGQPGTPTAPGQIQVTLDDDPAFAIVASPDSTGPGSVTFSVENAGTATHNFNIVKTELAADKLPVNSSTFKVDETQLDILATIADFSAGETQTATADLQPGAYVIFCNVPAHYGQGMHAAFTVGPSGGGGAPPP